MAFSEYLDVIGPSRELSAARVSVADSPSGPTLWLTGPGGELPAGLGWDALLAAGFEAKIGTFLVIPGQSPTAIAGVGDGTHAEGFRDAAGLASRALKAHAQVSLVLPRDAGSLMVRAAVEGALLARYRYDSLRTQAQGLRITELTVVGTDVEKPARQGLVFAGATALTRDLANTPHNHLTATRYANLIGDLAREAGLEVEVWDQQRCIDERLGGLLGINAGSAQEARFVRLRYRASGSAQRTLGLVGKGVMYDSGGIGLKPNNDSHAQMKNDMTGSAAIVAAMLALPALGAPQHVTGYLMCTDNMPSATATALGDVVKGRGGETIEILDTDAEGRVIMSDGLTLAVEDGVDAIVDIATLTGSVARAFGPLLSGVTGSDDGLVELVTAAASVTGEPVALMPLEHRYRPQLESAVADIRNVGPLGQPDGILSALFLHHFAHGKPWAHLDIAGTAFSYDDAGWRTPGCTGTGARTLLAMALAF